MEIQKIIRDKIPKIVAENGGDPMIVTFVDDKQALELLVAKLDEEVEELKAEIAKQSSATLFNVSPVLLEMADVRDVMTAIHQKIGSTKNCTHTMGVDTIQKAHANKNFNGQFTSNVCLLK